MNYWSPRLVPFLLVVGTSWSQPPAASGKAGELAVGEYIRDDYLDTLQKTNSPLASLRPGEPQLVVVKKSDAGLFLSTILNFHDGGAEFQLRRTDPLRVQTKAGFDMSNLRFENIDAHHFRLGFDKFAVLGYTYVGDSGRYARRVLIGDYSDERGKHYIFGSDGVADFDGKKFKYSVGLDQVLNRFDYFQDDAQHEVIGFRKANRTLSLFHTSGEISQYLDKSPYLVMRQSK